MFLKILSSRFLLSAFSPEVATRVNFGKPGELVHLVVGYQPYCTEGELQAELGAQLLMSDSTQTH